MKKVDKKFLNRIADKIYNPKKKTFLALCDGNLHDGPDPTNPSRHMNCGVGELYFALTGQEPDTITTNTAINTILENTELEDKSKFAELLNEIPVANDDNKGDKNPRVFKSRAFRVSKIVRAMAALFA